MKCTSSARVDNFSISKAKLEPAHCGLLCESASLQSFAPHLLAFTRYCHHQYCMAYGVHRGGGGGLVGDVYCTMAVH